MGVVDEVKARLDIVDLVREYVPSLKQAGTNFRACCPFHNEKTPSFMVSADKQIFKCFGCNEGGSVFDFFMKMEGVEFPEALRTLAARVGVALVRRDVALENKTTRMLDAIEEATAFFQSVFKLPVAASVRDYMFTKRGLTQETVTAFRVGLSPDAWQGLTSHLLKKGFKKDEMVGAGLVIEKEGKLFDRFRRRIMFPIADSHSSVVGFTGRLLPEDEGRVEAGKYVNTPATLLYDKSKILYGFDRAKSIIRQQGKALIAEGQMDVIALHQLGFPYAVATSGTALTTEQVTLLKRYTSTLVLAFDADAAGQEALRRGAEAALRAGMSVKVLRMPTGAKDPGDCLVHSQGKDMLSDAIAHTKDLVQYLQERACETHSMVTVDGKKAIVAQVLPMLALLPNRVEQDHYLRILAERLQVGEEALRASIPRGSVSSSPTTPATSFLVTSSRRAMLAQHLMALITMFPTHIKQVIDHVRPEYIEPLALREWYTSLIVAFTHSEQGVQDFLHNNIQAQDLKLRASANSIDILDGFQAQQEVTHLTRALRRDFVSERLKAIERMLRQGEVSTPPSATSPDLMKEFHELSEQLQSMS